MYSENYSRPSPRNFNHPSMANTSLVLTGPSYTLLRAMDPQINQETSGRCPSPRTTPTSQQAMTNGLPTLRESFTKYNVSPEITKILMASWQDSTKKQYKVHLEKWFELCHQGCIFHSSPKVNEALDFLMVLKIIIRGGHTLP